VVEKALAAPADVHPQVLTLRTSRLPWRSTVSVRMAAFLLVALVVMTCTTFCLVDATCFASARGARGAQPVLHTNTTGYLEMVSCHSVGIYFDPLSGMSLVLPSGIHLLHREAVVRCNAAGLMPEAVHVKMLPPSELGLSGFRHSDWHQNATEGMPCTPKSLPSWSVRLVTSARLAADKSAAAQRV
jgi:hypothetical protein